MEAQVLTSAQRRYLKSLAHHLKALLQVGKDGTSAAFLAQLLEQVQAHELIKLRILKNCTAEDTKMREDIESSGVTVVGRVGNVYTVFKQREEGSQVELPKPKK